MSFLSRILCALLPLICGALLSLLMFYEAGAPEKAGTELDGRYAVLIVDEAEDDMAIREILAAGELENFISESTQFVPVDDFGTLRSIPLASFRNEIETFDPRDDGYADKLRSFFVHEGERFFFAPLELHPLELRKRLEQNLAGIPFTLKVLEQEKSYLVFFVLLAAAGFFTLFFSRSKRLFMFQLPLLIAVAWGGFAAITLAALLACVWELMREPLMEFFTARFSGRSAFDYAGNGLKGIIIRLRPYRLNMLLFLLLLAVLFALPMAGFFSWFSLLAALFCFFVNYYLSFRFRAAFFGKNRHAPFNPVLILPLRKRTFFLFPFLIPYVLVSVFALVLPGILPENNKARPRLNPFYFVTREDFSNHLDHQRSFSYRPLDSGTNSYQDEYLTFHLGEDGLISGYAAEPKEIESLPFPLEKLMAFLIDYHEVIGRPAEKEEPVYPSVKLKEWMLAAIILTACMLDSLGSGKAVHRKAYFYLE